MVLHADNLGDAVRLFELGRGHIAQAELSDQALTLKVSEGCNLFLDRALGRFRKATDAQIDYIERIDAEIPEEVVVNRAREVSRCERVCFAGRYQRAALNTGIKSIQHRTTCFPE